MIIKKIYLKDFRNFEKKLLDFSNKTTMIVGPNASGKTNIIESIYLLSTGKSFRARVQEEMISYDEELARVKGLFEEGGEETKLEVVLTRGEITVGESPEKTEKVARKRLLVSGVGKRLVDFSGQFRTTLFGPHHLDLVTESPSTRRDFLDDVLSQVDREYRRASRSYSKGIRQRNKLLYRIREEGVSRSQLLFWDKMLIKNGTYISRKREELIDFINDTKPLKGHKFSLEYDKSAISEGRLDQYKEEEIAAATTLVGPHRDDLVFFEKRDRKEREMAKYASRGEQRMSVLWLKLAEMKYLEEEERQNDPKINTKPTLLLDDIFSELDDNHREVVFEAVKGRQTIMTTADPHYLSGFKNLETIKLKR